MSTEKFAILNYFLFLFDYMGNDQSVYGKKLRYLIKAKGIKQVDLAEALGMPQSSISTWLNSEYPPLDFIEKVCGYFDIPLWRFFAPDDLVLPDMTPEEREVIRLFQLFPDDIKTRFVRLNRNISELLEHTLEIARKKR